MHACFWLTFATIVAGAGPLEPWPQIRGAAPIDRSGLALIHDVSQIQGETFNPATLTCAANMLLLKGHSEATRVFHTAIADLDTRPGNTLPDCERLILVMLLYYDLNKASQRPRFTLGAPVPDVSAADERALASFPVHVVDGFPLLLTAGYEINGAEPSPACVLAWCEQRCQPRRALLRPTTTPWSIVNDLEMLGVWVFDAKRSKYDRTCGKYVLCKQVASALQPAIGERALSAERIDEDWARLCRQLQTVQLRWSDEAQKYERVK